MEKHQNEFLLVRKRFNSEALFREYPPKIFNENKRIIYKIACPKGCIHKGELVFTKWKALGLSNLKLVLHDIRTELRMEENNYHYKPIEEVDGTPIEWYVNFADRHLFRYYGTGLFAQDEIQVAEHPVLGAIREALTSLEIQDARYGPYTRGVDASPTPVLIRGARRRVKILLDRNPAEGRPNGLYGSFFLQCTPEVVKKACKVINPPTISNIIAMEAPKGAMGRKYSFSQLRDIFSTAYTAFCAAQIESSYMQKNHIKVIIHTGNWGTGVYGGNKTLMALLQILAAYKAGIDILIYHTYNHLSSLKYSDALELVNSSLLDIEEPILIEQLLTRIKNMGFGWGQIDGN